MGATDSYEKLERNLNFCDQENKDITILGSTNWGILLLQSVTNNICAAVRMGATYDMFGLAQFIQEPTRDIPDQGYSIRFSLGPHCKANNLSWTARLEFNCIVKKTIADSR